MKRFLVGHSYGWQDSRFDPFRVVSRTEKSITADNGVCSWRMMIRHDQDGVEWVRDSANRSKKYVDAFTSRATDMESFIVRTDGGRYHVSIDKRTETLSMSRIAPYDLTHYHWARAKDNDDDVWDLFHPNGRTVHTLWIPADYDGDPYEYVSSALLRFDESAGLKPCIDHT